MTQNPDMSEVEQPKMVAVLWHEDFAQKAQIVGVFESEADAKALVEAQHGKNLFQSGEYKVTVRPLTKYRGDERLWP